MLKYYKEVTKTIIQVLMNDDELMTDESYFNTSQNIHQNFNNSFSYLAHYHQWRIYGRGTEARAPPPLSIFY